MIGCLGQAIAACTVCIVPLLQPVGAEAQAIARPNVIVVLVDDWGVMDSSVPFLSDDQGRPIRHTLNEEYRTPNLERLARQGMRLSQFYAMSVCSPTRVSLMTGQTSARHGTTNWIDPEANNAGEFGPAAWAWQGPTPSGAILPRQLREAGYRTIHCGKGHFGPFDSDAGDPRNLGFDVNIGGTGAGQPGSYYGEKNFGNNPGRRSRWGVPSLERYHGRDIFLTEALTREFNRAIADAVRDRQPFFGYFSHYAVHAPFEPDRRLVDHYAGQPADLAAFSSLVEGVDLSLGEVLAQLEVLGVAQDTLIFVLGDNGTDAPRGDSQSVSCAAPLRGKKGTPYEGGMRVPFVAAWAKPASNELQQRWPIAADGISRQVGAVYDLMPTILSVCQIDPTPGQPIDGISLWKALTGENLRGQPRDFLMHYPHEHRGSYFTVFRRGDRKLIYHYRRPAGERIEMFDLAADPSESINLAAAEPEQIERMVSAMRSALDDAAAQYPLADDRRTALEPTLD
jgi:arylsulfatase A-like enzyme